MMYIQEPQCHNNSMQLFFIIIFEVNGINNVISLFHNNIIIYSISRCKDHYVGVINSTLSIDKSYVIHDKFGGITKKHATAVAMQ